MGLSIKYNLKGLNNIKYRTVQNSGCFKIYLSIKNSISKYNDLNNNLPSYTRKLPKFKLIHWIFTGEV